MSDVSCRLAWPADAGAIAAVQVRAWRSSYVDLLPADVLETLVVDELAEAWRTSTARPDDARQRVLVALAHDTLVGFVLTGPGADADLDPGRDGELADLTVDPEHRRAGHGSRLMQAAVDTLRADRFARALTWVPAADDATRALLVSAGWAPDGAHRELDLRGDGDVTVRQVRLHAALD